MSKKPAAKKKSTSKKKVVAKKAAPPKKKVAPPKKKAAAPKKKVAPPKKKVAPPKKKAAAPKKKVAPPPPPPSVVKKAAPPPEAPNPLKAHAWRDVSVSIDGELHKVIFFDWDALSEARRDPSPTAKYHPNRNPFAWVEQFDEYIVGHWCDPVDEGAWEPIAVVGLGHASTTESFAEMNNRGFLAVVRDGGSFPAGTVLWLDGPRYDKDEPFILAPDVSALQIIRR